MRVVLAGGGTAGHVEPALATADALRRSDPGTAVLMLGTERGLESRLVPARGYELALVPAVPLPRRPNAALFRLPGKITAAVSRAVAVIREHRADVVVGFGGYVALPAYLAARRLRIPVVVHEANARPGLANRIGARGAAMVASAVAVRDLRGARTIGIPLRRSVAEVDRRARRSEAAERYGLDPDLPTLLVFGGSQGALRINTAVLGAASELSAAGIQVLHAVGSAHIDHVTVPRTEPGAPVYRVVEYLDRMDLAYSAADLALCRSGATTCAEVAAVGLPAVFVPLPHGNGEQRLNAEPLVSAGAAVLVADAELEPARVISEVSSLLGDSARLDAAGAAATSLGRPDADEALVAMIRAAVEQNEARG